MTQNVNTAQPVQKNPVSAFRHWVTELWLDNCEEHLTYGEDPYTIKQYWGQYKWFLREMYRHQKDS